MRKSQIYFFYLLGLITIFTGWWTNSGSLFTTDSASIFLALGRIFGLLAFYGLLCQFLLIGRIPFFTKRISFDRLTRWHHYHSMPVVLFILLHFIFITTSASSFTGSTFLSQLANFLRFEETRNAFIALCLFLAIGLISYIFSRIKMKYENWYFIHLMVYVAILVSFGHQLELGGDFSSFLFRAFWLGLGLAVLCLFVWYRFIVLLIKNYRHQFVVNRVVNENSDSYSIYISGSDIEKYRFQPGQFAGFRFLATGLFFQAHPFSFSSVPGQTQLRITIKNLGDYTKELVAQLKPGVRVIIDGPHGQFVITEPVKKAVLIAGGIGITPIISLLASLKNRPIEKHCFYSAKNQTEFIFTAELNQLEPSLHYHESDTTGHLTLEHIKSVVSNLSEYHYYICGPQPMLKVFRSALLAAGVSKGQIHYELFSY